MTLTRWIGWSSLSCLAAAMIPALYLKDAMHSLLLNVVPGGQQAATAVLLGLLVLSYRK